MIVQFDHQAAILVTGVLRDQPTSKATNQADKPKVVKEPEKETILRTRNKASELLNDAENKSNKIIEDAEEEAKSTRDTLLFLKEQQEILVTRLKIIVDSQEGLLNDLADGKNTAQILRLN